MSFVDGLILATTTLLVVSWLAYGVSMLRTKQRPWMGVLATLSATALFLVAGFGLHFVNQATDSLFQSLAVNKSLAPLPTDWGSKFSTEDRMRYSLSMARSEYLQRGTLRDYIDVTGSRHTFTPDENDKEGRQQYIENLESKKQIGEFAEWSIYGLLLLYGLGVALGFSGRWQRIVALTLRSSGSAQKRAAP